MPAAAISELVQVDLLAAMVLTRELLPAMLERDHGHVLNVGSVVGSMGGGQEAAYAACKAGLRGFTEALRQEHAGSRVGFSLVAPGPVDTPFFGRRGAAYERPFPRPVTAESVAAAAVRAIRDGRPEVFVPAWLGLAARVRGAAPELYRPLVDRFG
jgi:short-subunit dehydrogenase